MLVKLPPKCFFLMSPSHDNYSSCKLIFRIIPKSIWTLNLQKPSSSTFRAEARGGGGGLFKLGLTRGIFWMLYAPNWLFIVFLSHCAHYMVFMCRISRLEERNYDPEWKFGLRTNSWVIVPRTCLSLFAANVHVFRFGWSQYHFLNSWSLWIV